ncbi:hypothetical protein ACFPYI_21875 [Halomarina salina]|uniref:DUF8160 domain-containing protein n=1 Tax=Halomarina salina TaxID=1872699 RepID=A0ABD5RU65_9EURY|nr:hypothetical protein [Halomarina salina]
MDERFEDPSDGASNEDAATEEDPEMPVESEAASDRHSNQHEANSTADANSSASEADATGDEPLNIRQDWDSATIYVEPEQSEEIEITFTRLKKQLKREGVTLEKNKHFYRGVFEVAFGDYQEETKERIRELAEQDVDQ